MHLLNLNLLNFRSYQKRRFTFSKRLTVIVGKNTSGKTNLLEAIFTLSTGKSFRADKENEMISFGAAVGRVKGEIKSQVDREQLEIVLTPGELYGRKIATKRYFVNGVSKRTIDFIGKLRLSLFWPQDIDLIIASPSIRRRYLDFVLIQVDVNYLRQLRIYEKALRFRNKLLERIREGEAKKEELPYWDQLLIKNGSYLTKLRQEYLNFLNRSGTPMDGNTFKIIYDHSLINSERLAQYASQEIMAATTLVGPHRDDFSIKIQSASGRTKSKTQDNIRDLSIFGSRGEQRLGILWLKLGELAFIKEKSNGEEPILLLDDIFSEFDHHNRLLVFEHIGNQQTIITTTDIHLIEDKLRKEAEIIELT
ncbi:MAG: DNA replication and repair protein RecF [Patescibacteria group bacterium]|nr:DNA replication and repair protein RecF [Patescibacteria group bacterium]